MENKKTWLTEASHRQYDIAERKLRKALDDMVREMPDGVSMTVAELMRRAEVSRTTVYAHRDVVENLNKYRFAFRNMEAFSEPKGK